MSRQSKQIHPERIATSLPALADAQAVGAEGLLDGLPFKLSWSDGFHVTAPPGEFHGADFSRDDIVLDTDMGRVVLERPLITRVDFDGAITGNAIATHLTRDDVPGPKVRRTFVTTDDSLWSRVCFPRRLVFTNHSGGAATAYLPLVVDGVEIDVFYVKEGPFLVIEAPADVEQARYRQIAGATRLLLTYLTGERFDDDSCDVVAVAASDEVIEAHWYVGRSIARSIYHPIPMAWPEVTASHRGLKLPGHPSSALVPDRISACVEYLLANPAAGTALEYLIRFSQAPVEMRGAFLSVALESFTDHLVKAGVLAELQVLPDPTWDVVRKGLLDALDATAVGCTAEQREILRNRIDNLNKPTNNQKLMQPFEVVGVALTTAQKKAIDRRNKLLHQGRLLDPEVVAADPSAWRRAYEIEMHLYTAINALVLKRMGYSGALIDWGRTSLDTGEQVYVAI